MNTTHCLPASQACDTDCKTPMKINLPSCGSLLLLPARLVAVTVQGTAEVVKQTFDGTLKGPEPCCVIPEIDCPDPCVAKVHWAGCPGDSFTHKLQVTNTSKQKRDFTLTPDNFVCTEEAVTVAPASKSLDPNQSLQATITFKIPDSLAAGQYHAKVRIEGAYEQWVLVCLTVRASHCCCTHVEQGDKPIKVKAHHWYHHFQCEEVCAP